MALADLDDINAHLPLDKLGAKDGDPNVATASIDSERIIRGQLAGHIAPATLAAWVGPSTTPDIIRAIAGRLIAALIYAKAFSSSEITEVPAYAQMKYNEAMAMLMGIITGSIIIDGIVVEEQLNDTRFWPNNTTAAAKFNMQLDFS